MQQAAIDLFLVLIFALFLPGSGILAWRLFRALEKHDSQLGEMGKYLDQTSHSQERHFQQIREDSAKTASMLRMELLGGMKHSTDSLVNMVARINESQQEQLGNFSGRLGKLEETMDRKFTALQDSVEKRLGEIRLDNEKKLDAMRKTVDEKLQGTLEARLGESFKLVSQQLDMVSRGLGEMKQLASGVGDLKKVLNNVKTRGTWGEIAAGNILEQLLAPGQYGKSVEVRKGSGERVDFAVKMPGPGREVEGGDAVWLPLDAKFPKESYERLIDASERGDRDEVARSGDQLERQVRLNAKSISEKYINPPATTDFGIMFLPSEGLYAEVLRRPGLGEEIQSRYRIVVAGPSTLAALLNSLQMGFQTLAIQKRSGEVWKTLGEVKEEFSKFGDVLNNVRSKLDQAARTIDKAEVRTRAIHRKLRDVNELEISGGGGSD